MECPHCNYKSTPQDRGEHGAFYHNYQDMKRTTENFFGSCNFRLYGCPCCKKTFIA